MTSTDAVVKTLLWAAGAPGRPDLAGASEDDLFMALQSHRLVARLLFRAKQEGVLLPETLRERLRADHEAIVSRVHEQIAQFARLRDQLAERAPACGLVPLKGFSLYALTNDDEHAAYSRDIDVLGGDPREVAAAVEAMGGRGYHFHGEEHPYVFAHMDEVEVHYRYIVTGMPTGLAAKHVDVQSLPGVIELVQPFVTSSISYSDIAECLVDGVGPAAGIRVPSPEMTLLIRCAHIYVGFAMNTHPLPWATVRLEELVQMRDLLSLPSFDDARFNQLHRTFGAGLVTDFARFLHQELLGDDPFTSHLEPAEGGREWFPRNLWWDGSAAGFPVQLPWQPLDMVQYGAEAEDLTEVVGFSTFSLSAPNHRITLACDATPDEAEAERYVWHRFDGGIGRIVVELLEIPDGVRVGITVPAVAANQMVPVGWASGQFRYEVFYRPSDGTHDFADYSRPRVGPDEAPRVVTCLQEPSGQVSIVAEFPWSAIGLDGPPVEGEAVPLVIRVRTQERPWGKVAGGAVLSLRLTQ